MEKTYEKKISELRGEMIEKIREEIFKRGNRLNDTDERPIPSTFKAYTYVLPIVGNNGKREWVFYASAKHDEDGFVIGAERSSLYMSEKLSTDDIRNILEHILPDEKQPTIKKSVVKKEKINVFYGTEENGFEADHLAEVSTIEEAKEFIANCLKEEVEEEYLQEELEYLDSNGWEGENANGYHIVFLIGGKRECKSELSRMRRDFIRNC